MWKIVATVARGLKKLFNINSYFICSSKWRILTVGKKKVEVYEQIQCGYLPTLLNSFGIDLDRMCFIRDQIDEFCRKYPQYIKGCGHILFLSKNEMGEIIVVNVYWGAGDVDSYSLGKLEDVHIWEAGSGPSGLSALWRLVIHS